MRNLARHLALLLIAAGAAGCRERVVKYDPFLAGLPGAESQTPVERNLGHADPRRMNGGKIRTENLDGTVTLVSKSGLHVMVHTFNTLVDDEKELFLDQVLSERTKQEYIAAGRDAGEIFEQLVREFDDFEEMCLLMPAGEFTPGIYLRPMGSRVQRFELDGAAARGLRFRGLDIVMEKGNYRLVRVIENRKPARREGSTKEKDPRSPSSTGLGSIQPDRR